jgi:hypothetical protein
MTQTMPTTIRVPWLATATLRRREAEQRRPPRPHASLLSPRPRRALGAALTLAGAGTIATSAAGVAAQPTPQSAVQLLLAVAATVTVAHCATTAREAEDR